MPVSFLSRAFLGVLGLLVLIVLWEGAGRLGWFGPSWPPLSGVLSVFSDAEKQALFARATRITAVAAITGYAIGIGIAFALAVLSALVPATRAGLSRFAALVNAVPIIALGPILLATMARPSVPVAVAAVLVFFTTFVAATAGFEAAPRTYHDLFTVLGARRRLRFLKLQLPSSLPTLVSGFKIGAPAAVLGAILGEWFGAEHGLGPVLVASMQDYQIDLLWAAALVSALLSMIAYGAMSLVEQQIIERVT